MSQRIFLRSLMTAPPALRASLVSVAPFTLRPHPPQRYASSLPSVTQPSFWRTLVPKPLRRSEGSGSEKKLKVKSKEWNPATFYIVIFLLIGSMSIQMITLRHEFSTFSRRADAKIDLLKEIIERVQKGEDVDVEGLLGTGDPNKEKEWEEVLKDIEREDELWNEARRKKPTHAPKPDNANIEAPADVKDTSKQEVNTRKAKTNAPSGFY